MDALLSLEKEGIDMSFLKPKATISDETKYVVLKILYIIIRVHSVFSLVASCVLLKYTRTDDVN